MHKNVMDKKDDLHNLLPHEDEERLEKVFAKLDLDGNGKIDIHDLSVALKQLGVHHHYAEVCEFIIHYSLSFVG